MAQGIYPRLEVLQMFSQQQLTKNKRKVMFLYDEKLFSGVFLNLNENPFQMNLSKDVFETVRQNSG